MKIGFTGSREGMTDAQVKGITLMLKTAATRPEPQEFHHGDCLGADDQANHIAREIGIRTVAHPCNISSMRAHSPSDEVRDVKPPIERNHDIVDETDVLLATPSSMTEVLRSGTWATIRYWRKHKRTHLRIVLPDGEVLTR